MTEKRLKLSEVKNLKDREGWERTVEANQDDYGYATLVGASRVMAALDEGKKCKEAEGELYGLGLTGFMAGCIASIVSQVHERGDEFRKWWNVSLGADESAKGTVNPALMTISNGSRG